MAAPGRGHRLVRVAPTERLDGQAVPRDEVLYDPFLAQVHAGMALSLHPGPRARLNGGVGMVGQKFQLASTGHDSTRLGVGWELNAMWTWDVGRKWAVGLGLGTTGHFIPRAGPDKNLFSGGEAGLRISVIQDGMKEVWLSPREKAAQLKQTRAEERADRREPDAEPEPGPEETPEPVPGTVPDSDDIEL